MSSDAFSQEIESLTQSYLKRSPGDLETLLQKELNKIKPQKEVPFRGKDKEFWLGVRRRLTQKIVDNKIAVSSIIGFAANEVIAWAVAIGLNLLAYKIPIAILTAMIVQSVLEQLGEELSNSG